jgi:hydroxymethylglutaryl-CoA synthase
MATKAHARHYENNFDCIIEKDTPEYESFRQSFSEKTSSWLSLNAQVGNIYTGSIFLSLMDLLRQAEIEPGQRISLFSYGSGCAASISTATLSSGYQELKSKVDPSLELADRTRLTLSEYENLMKSRNDVIHEEGTLDPNDWGLVGKYLYLGNKGHIRQYSDFKQ